MRRIIIRGCDVQPCAATRPTNHPPTLSSRYEIYVWKYSREHYACRISRPAAGGPPVTTLRRKMYFSARDGGGKVEIRARTRKGKLFPRHSFPPGCLRPASLSSNLNLWSLHRQPYRHSQLPTTYYLYTSSRIFRPALHSRSYPPPPLISSSKRLLMFYARAMTILRGGNRLLGEPGDENRSATVKTVFTFFSLCLS